MALSTKKKKKKRGRKRKEKPPSDPGDFGERHHLMRAEFDSHADTCTFSEDDCLILGTSGDSVQVGGWSPKLGSLAEVPIVDLAVAYDCPKTGQTAILVFHQCLTSPGMKRHLLNLYQMRHQGIIINETPLQQLPYDKRDSASHSIISTDPEFQIPLVLNGVMSGFDVRKPNWDEVNDPNVLLIHMTSTEEWEPYDSTFEEVKQRLRDQLD